MPVIENLKLIRDTVTNKTFACTAVTIDVPQDWRTAITPAVTRHGGVDAHAGSNDYLSPRTITTTLLHRYDRVAGETYKTVIAALETVITRGNPLELTTIEEDGTTWIWENVRLTKYDKKLNRDIALLCTIPLAFVAPDPRQRGAYQPGRPLLNNGLFLDNGVLLNDDTNSFPLTGAQTTRTILNTGSAPDDAPIVTLTGPIDGQVQFFYFDDVGNQTGWTYSPDPATGTGIATGEQITVDAEQPEVLSSNPAVTAYARFAPFPNQEGYGRVSPGTTTVVIIVGASGTPASATIRWFPRK